MQANELRPSPSRPSDDAWARAAFHELHGRSLHGFALLLVLGDHGLAGRLAGRAIGMGMARVDEHRHPERAAAWLRARVVRSAAGIRASHLRPSSLPLEGLGAGASVVAGLGALSTVERAALIASMVELLDPRDVAEIVGRDGARLRHTITTARRRYLAASLQAEPEREPALQGPIVERLHDIAHRTIG